jgi:hypothetical protein
MICDFCSAEDQRGLWFYPHAHFEIENVCKLTGQINQRVVFKAGMWGCCDMCAALFEAKNIEGLLERAIAKHGQRCAEVLEVAYNSLIQNREGPPQWSEDIEVKP